MEVSRLVETPVAYFVRSFAAPTSNLPVDSSPPLASVDPLPTLPATKIASTRLVLATVLARQVGRPKSEDL